MRSWNPSKQSLLNLECLGRSENERGDECLPGGARLIEHPQKFRRFGWRTRVPGGHVTRYPLVHLPQLFGDLSGKAHSFLIRSLRFLHPREFEFASR